jgi:hypothetical protein
LTAGDMRQGCLECRAAYAGSALLTYPPPLKNNMAPLDWSIELWCFRQREKFRSQPAHNHARRVFLSRDLNEAGQR